MTGSQDWGAHELAGNVKPPSCHAFMRLRCRVLPAMPCPLPPPPPPPLTRLCQRAIITEHRLAAALLLHTITAVVRLGVQANGGQQALRGLTASLQRTEAGEGVQVESQEGKQAQMPYNGKHQGVPCARQLPISDRRPVSPCQQACAWQRCQVWRALQSRSWCRGYATASAAGWQSTAASWQRPAPPSQALPPPRQHLPLLALPPHGR